MRAPKVKAGSAWGAVLGIVGMSAIAGVLVTAMVTPALAVTGMTANNSIGIFENLPGYIKPDALSQKSNIYAKNADGSPVFLASVFDQDREMVGWDAISQYAKDALVSTEDPRFYSHGGVDVQSSVRALIGNAASGGVTSGASTISMQYVKNILVQKAEDITDPAQRQAAYDEAVKTSVDRKLKEMKLAIGLEKDYSKDDILLGYLNIALFGGRVYGIEAASEYYFGVPASQLTLPQAASLVGTVQNPESFRIDDPANIPANTQRRAYVLSQMLREGKITQKQYDDAIATPVTPKITPPSTGCQTAGNGAGFFCDYVLNVITHDPAFGADPDERERNLRTGGYSIYTTLNPQLQAIAWDDMNSFVPKSMENFDLGSVIVSVEPGTGRILNMVQNKDYNQDPSNTSPGATAVNYATDYEYGGSTGFQVGSTYKVFVLTEWLKQGHALGDVVNGNSRPFNLSTFKNSCEGPGGGTYSPKNDASQSPGNMTVQSALTNSVNAAFITMTQQLDSCKIRSTAESLGVHRADGNQLTDVPSASLGTNEIAPLTMAAAFATMAANGKYCAPVAIDSIVDANGAQLAVPVANCTQVLDPNLAATVALAMKGPITSGTAAPSNPGNGIQHIGKTGTTDGEVHTWVVGGTTKITTAVWVGNVQGSVSLANVRVDGTTGSSVRHVLMRTYLTESDAIFGGDAFPTPNSSLLNGVQIQIPNVVGMSLKDAQAAISAAGLDPQDGGTVDGTQAAGIVTATDGAGGTSTGRGSSVMIYTSNGQLSAVPTVAGMSVGQARSTLQSQGWTNVNGTLRQQTTDGNCNPDVVIGSDAWAGYVGKKDTPITLIVCKKP